MCSLAKSGIIAHEYLKENLKPYGYAPARITQGIWTHQDRDIILNLVVDNFGIRYRNKKYADHLISALQAKYGLTQDWTGGIILQNNTGMGLNIQTTGNLNVRILERHNPKIPTHHPNQTIALTPPVYITKLRVHSAPTGIPRRRLTRTKSR